MAQQEEKKEEQVKNETNIDSNIMTKDEQQILISLLKDGLKNKGLFSLNILFRMSKDGKKAIEFHDACDNKGATVTIVETEFNHVFGAFTNIGWKNHFAGKYEIDNDMFIFLLRSSKKFNHQPKIFKPQKIAKVFHSREFGPHFDDIRICPQDRNKTFILSNAFNLNGNALCGGKEYINPEKQMIQQRMMFDVKEYEVFQIQFQK
eukprot:300039_1